MQKFKGLGGASRESTRKWRIPTGISGHHVVQEFYEIPGDMMGLTSRDDLESWGANLFFRKNATTMDLVNVGVYGKVLSKTSNRHAAP